MFRVVFMFFVFLITAGCTSVQVKPVSSSSKIDHICIEKNNEVIVSDFLGVLRNRIEYHGIQTSVHDAPDPNQCRFILTYTAFKTWDIGTYMHRAELRLEENGVKAAQAEYRLRGKGGLSLMKWRGTKSKMHPVIDQLLAK